MAKGRSAETTSTTALGIAEAFSLNTRVDFCAGGRVQARHDVEHFALAGEVLQAHVLEILVDQREIGAMRTRLGQLAGNGNGISFQRDIRHSGLLM